MENKSNNEIKLYSEKAIDISTLVGGPLAAGYLISMNLKSLGKEQAAKKALGIGVVVTILIFVLLFSLPQEFVDKIPQHFFPLVYTGITMIIVRILLGKELKEHKENGNPFYSGWKAAGIGLICSLIMIAGIFSYIFLKPAEFDTNMYEMQINEFSRNEKTAMEVFTHIDNMSEDLLIKEFENDTKIWEKNIYLLDEILKIKNLPKDINNQTEKLKQYSKYRLESCKLFKKALIEKTNKYGPELDKLGKKIEEILKKLNNK